MIWEVFTIITSNDKEFAKSLLETEEDSDYSQSENFISGNIPALNPVSPYS